MSYATRDRDLAETLFLVLRARGHTVLFDRTEMGTDACKYPWGMDASPTGCSDDVGFGCAGDFSG